MSSSRKLVPLPLLVDCAFFILYFLYFAIFNRYNLAFQEQIQLFCIDWNYFTSFLTKPGGFTKYIGAFFIQFYLNPIIGAFILTLAGIAAYTLVRYILRKYKVFGTLWSLIPVLLLLALQSDYKYELGFTLGYLLVLIFTALYISLCNNNLRYATGFIGWFFLYLLTGCFSLLATILCIIHELFFTKTRYRFFIALGYVLIAVLFPYLAWHSIYYIPLTHAWLSPILFAGNVNTKYGMLLLLVYLPILLIVIKIWVKLSKKTEFIFGWNPKSIVVGIVAGIIIIFAFNRWGKLVVYNLRNEFLLRIDNSVQHAEWNQVLKLSSRYSGTNRFILYYTNLALYKSGQLGNKMFYYNQISPHGLHLNWAEDDFTLFFGCEIFYHLGYINEAYRGAFEAMVVTGQSPRLLKRLILTSLINENYAIAEKYLNVLDQTLFYREWAQHYRNFIYNTNLLLQDQEIIEKRHLMIHTDFFADSNFDFELSKLLENHPDNRMAFEYYMASLLLEKNLTSFAANICHLKDYGIKEIPVHYEEALLLYMVNIKKNTIPEAYMIRESTIQRFKDYLNTSSPFSSNPALAVKELGKVYGKTYWFYWQFY